jgi:hypothetical protein
MVLPNTSKVRVLVKSMRAAGAIQVGLGELRTPNPYSMDWFRGKFTGKPNI